MTINRWVAAITVCAAMCSAQAQERQRVSPELRADILMARKMYREAIDTYKEAGDTPVILNKTGIAYHQLNDLANAKLCYEKATKLKPDYAEAINNLGALYYNTKSYRRAIKLYKKALLLEPASAPFLSNLGTAYFARKNYDLAFAKYQEALKIDPEVFESRNATGSTLLERSGEERAKYHFFLARAYAKEGAMERALQCLRQALEEGFNEREKIFSLPEFAPLRGNEEFQRMMSVEQKVI
jgi:tetratricopeptide (TPR) repeat protein